MENGFDPLLVSEGQVTVGLKAISAAQDDGSGTPVTAHLARQFDGSRTVNDRKQGLYTHDPPIESLHLLSI
jgi:hypothetical protein